MAQRMQVVSSFSMTPPRSSSSSGGSARRVSVADAEIRGGGVQPVLVVQISVLSPTSRIRFSGHTSTQPLQATQMEVSKPY